MTKFTFTTQPRYDRSHGNITHSVDSQLSRFSFNIRRCLPCINIKITRRRAVSILRSHQSARIELSRAVHGFSIEMARNDRQTRAIFCHVIFTEKWRNANDTSKYARI